MATKVSALTRDTAPSTDDYVLAVDNASSTSKKVTMGDLVQAGLPTQTSNSGKFLTTNGSVASWATVTGFLTSGAIGTTVQAFSATLTTWAGKTPPSGTVVGTTDTQTLSGKTLTAPVIATISNTGILTLPTSTDTLIGRATTDTLTNKTFDTAGTGNVFKINGVTISANTGTGSNVLATSPTLTTPNLGTPSTLTLTNATGLPIGGISATGTPSSTTYLRGDGSWATVSGGGGSTPMTTLGDLTYEDATPTPARLAGNTTTTKKFLTQTGNGTISAVPGWNTLVAGDVPNIAESQVTNLTTDLAAKATRTDLTSTAVIYVTPTGNDSNDGLTWGSAKLTLAAAISALPSSGGRVKLGPGGWSVTSASRTDTVSYSGAGNVFNDVSAISGDVGKYVLWANLGRVAKITSVVVGVSFTVDVLPLTTAATTAKIVTPGIVIPEGVVLEGSGPNFNHQLTAGSATAQVATQISDSGTGVTVLIQGANSFSGGSTRYGISQMSVLGNASNTYGLFVGNGAWYIESYDLELSSHGLAGLGLDGNINSHEFHNLLLYGNGKATATTVTGGIITHPFNQGGSASCTFYNAFFSSNIGFGIADGDTGGAYGVILHSPQFNSQQASLMANSGTSMVLQVPASNYGMAVVIGGWSETAALYDVITSGYVTIVGMRMHSSHAYHWVVNGGVATAIGCTFEGATSYTAQLNSGGVFSWNGLKNDDTGGLYSGAPTPMPAVGTSGTLFGATLRTNALTATGDFTVKDAVSPTKAMRFQTSAAALDVAFGGTSVYFSNWTAAAFTGTQNFYMAWDTSGNADAFGVWRHHSAPFGTTYLTIDPGNATTPLQIHGGLSMDGATSGTTSLVPTAIAGTTTLTLPAATDTLVGRATTDTLTNKSLTSPNITTGATVKAGGTLTFENALANANMTLTNAGGTGVAYFAVAGGNLNIASNRLGVGLNNGGSASIETVSNGGSSIQGLRIQGSATTDLAFTTFVSGDAQLRFLFQPDGTMAWGSGAATTDATITRTAVGELTITSKLKLATLTATGAVTSSGGGIGYATGAGGTVTQATSKATGVTLNKLSGAITLNAAALAAATTVSFVLTNSFIAATDLLVLNHTATGSFGSYNLNAHGAGAGSITIDVRNISAGSLSEAIVLSFAIVKAVTA